MFTFKLKNISENNSDGVNGVIEEGEVLEGSEYFFEISSPHCKLYICNSEWLESRVYYSHGHPELNACDAKETMESFVILNKHGALIEEWKSPESTSENIINKCAENPDDIKQQPKSLQAFSEGKFLISVTRLLNTEIIKGWHWAEEDSHQFRCDHFIIDIDDFGNKTLTVRDETPPNIPEPITAVFTFSECEDDWDYLEISHAKDSDSKNPDNDVIYAYPENKVYCPHCSKDES